MSRRTSANEERGGAGTNASTLTVLDECGSRLLVHGSSHDQCGTFHLRDWVHIVTHDGLCKCLIEAMCRSDHNMEASVVNGQGTRFCQSIEEIERRILMALLFVF